jgi:hypothetical protein
MMKKLCALMVCVTVCGAALFAQTEADFDTKANKAAGTYRSGDNGAT